MNGAQTEIKRSNFEVSEELRWFLEGSIPLDVERWFSMICSSREERETPRTDYYLVATDADFVGLKLREAKHPDEGKLELKIRERSEEFEGLDGIAGRIERWGKWVWNYSGLSELQLFALFQKGTDAKFWLAIPKERRRAKFELTQEGSVVLVTPDTKVSVGVSMELTSLSGGAWWSLAFDGLGVSEPATILRKAARRVLTDYPGPRLDTARSLGYPAWILKMKSRLDK